MSSLVTKVKLKQIEQLIEKGKRLDERGLLDTREIKIEQGVIEKAEGSARVYLGKTQILVGVKVGTRRTIPRHTKRRRLNSKRRTSSRCFTKL